MGAVNNLLDQTSNALGTDGSKNGLLNDPVSMGALAIGAAIATGGVSLGAEAVAGGTAAAGEGLSLAASDAAFSTAVADASATAAVGSGISWGAIGSGAAAAGKFLLPLALQGNAAKAQSQQYQQQALNRQYQTPQTLYGVAHDNGTTYPTYAGNSNQGIPSGFILLAIAAAVAIAYSKK